MKIRQFVKPIRLTRVPLTFNTKASHLPTRDGVLDSFSFLVLSLVTNLFVMRAIMDREERVK